MREGAVLNESHIRAHIMHHLSRSKQSSTTIGTLAKSEWQHLLLLELGQHSDHDTGLIKDAVLEHERKERERTENKKEVKPYQKWESVYTMKEYSLDHQ